MLVAGVGIDPVTTHDVLALARERIAQRASVRVVTVNAEFVVRAQTDRAFAEVVEQADLATPDGSGILWALRRQGIRLPARVGGSDLIWALSDQARRLGHRVFLLGGAPGVAEQAAWRLQMTYAGLRVAGAYAGGPALADETPIVDLIRRSDADILFVAFGAPEQELWIARNLAATGASFAIGVGGSFDYLAGRASRAPVWMRERGVEWLWRLVRQPWRWRRMLALPRFVWLVLTSDRPAPH
jgi:N-acetylglucosaminyldiphosphoundecaprenol N-acetyl-beta-D-mannosaminyltransferase